MQRVFPAAVVEMNVQRLFSYDKNLCNVSVCDCFLFNHDDDDDKASTVGVSITQKCRRGADSHYLSVKYKLPETLSSNFLEVVKSVMKPKAE